MGFFKSKDGLPRWHDDGNKWGKKDQICSSNNNNNRQTLAVATTMMVGLGANGKHAHKTPKMKNKGPKKFIKPLLVTKL